MTQCDHHDDHNLFTDTPAGNRCGAPATHRIDWEDGRFSYGCGSHLKIDRSASVKAVRIVKLVVDGTAVLSEDGMYRTYLTREMGGDKPLVVIGANPSTADHQSDDQTILKEKEFARLWGCGMLIKVNMYGFRAKEPKDMWAAAKAGVDIVGADVRGLHNDDYVRSAIRIARDRGGKVLGAWGNIPKPERVSELVGKLREDDVADLIQCLGTNKNGSPKHTLYLPYETPLRRWAP